MIPDDVDRILKDVKAKGKTDQGEKELSQQGKERCYVKNKMIVLLIFVMMSCGGAAGTDARSRLIGKETQSGTPNRFLRTFLQENRPIAWWMLNRLADKLQLTETQREEINAIVAAELPAMQPFVQKMIDYRRQWRAENQTSDFNEAQIRTFAEQQSALMTELIVYKERIRHQVKMVLTGEQQDQVQEFVDLVEQRIIWWFTQWNA
ncbi:Spy/CpxP family protein refolding chaperone [Desulfoferrobacter suflitae]|uniref:Spy/CpxP family protein refolding chaperone n=1 Tax=Desulfoferrobacter suflitae TaxID=2865782 RepID=UPI002164BD96|nr:Spy/CpxP family protein refolding chaperone [Desulfoferrobacter suflitae]MCK8600127.1 Spy/CpxP family protein refolding chaperone [Desulfoferrobacter suflitae]